jgi:hypothetical protein
LESDVGENLGQNLCPEIHATNCRFPRLIVIHNHFRMELMKNRHRDLRIFATLTIFLIAGNAGAQSLTIDSLSGSNFCTADPLSVTFTATGTWGHLNAFTVQLSDTSGVFNTNLKNIGSLIDTLPGTFTIVTSISASDLGSTHYRIRVISANPYMVSPDNGSDIKVSYIPYPPAFYLGTRLFGTSNIGFSGVPIQGISFRPSPPPTIDSFFCNFGAGATPATASGVYSTTILKDSFVHITYSTPGYKYISVREFNTSTGCTTMAYDTLYVFDCTNPVIPHDAVVVDHDTAFPDNIDYTDNHESNKTFWVNPGVSLTLGDNIDDTIFAESGASIFGQGGQTYDIVYLKPGATSDPDFQGLVVYAPGAGVTTTGPEITTLECPDLAFDYTAAPPNVALDINVNESVTPAAPVSQIAISPNPTNGIVTLQNIPLGANVTVLNVLGVAVKGMARTTGSNFTLDLSQLDPGAYYIRCSSANSVVTKKVIKN